MAAPTLNLKRPCVLSIAGFDPSGGAGVLADIKTFEVNKVLGMGVVTGLTFQNDSEFDGVKWMEISEIIKQIEVLSRKFKFEFVKIGMIKDLEMLEPIISILNTQYSITKIIWDPILKASAGFEIHNPDSYRYEKEKLIFILKNIFLITPNMNEIRILTNENNELIAAKELSKYCNVFLKGGHSEKNKGRDYLFTTEGKEFSFRPKEISEVGKHGSGCVLSSAITANLAKGFNLHRSCLRAKDYTTKFLMSSKTLIGHHKS